MTYKIWSKKSGKILHRSAVRSAKTDNNMNYRADPHFDHDDHDIISESTTHPDTSRVLTAQDYGEKESGRPPDTPQIFIYIDNKDKDKDSPQLTYGEKADLTEGSSLERNDEVMAPTDAVYVVLNNDDGEPITDSEGKSILIKGMDHIELKGITLLRREEDGTKN